MAAIIQVSMKPASLNLSVETDGQNDQSEESQSMLPPKPMPDPTTDDDRGCHRGRDNINFQNADIAKSLNLDVVPSNDSMVKMFRNDFSLNSTLDNSKESSAAASSQNSNVLTGYSHNGSCDNTDVHNNSKFLCSQVGEMQSKNESKCADIYAESDGEPISSKTLLGCRDKNLKTNFPYSPVMDSCGINPQSHLNIGENNMMSFELEIGSSKSSLKQCYSKENNGKHYNYDANIEINVLDEKVENNRCNDKDGYNSNDIINSNDTIKLSGKEINKNVIPTVSFTPHVSHFDSSQNNKSSSTSHNMSNIHIDETACHKKTIVDNFASANDDYINDTEADVEPEQSALLDIYDSDLLNLSLTPHLHALLLASLSHRRNSNGCCPHLFERAAHTWWNPRFDSDILEDEYIRTTLPTRRLRLRYCLGYTALACLVWMVYWLTTASPQRVYTATFAGLLMFLMLVALAFTSTKYYVQYQMLVSVTVSVVLLSVSLLPYALHNPSLEMCTDLSSPTMMAITVQVLLMVYTLIPLSLHVAVVLCCSHSLLCELLNAVLTQDAAPSLVAVRAVLHLAVHCLAAHIMLMTQVRMRGTFLSRGQSLLVQRELDRERAVKSAMVHSIMPPSVAEYLLEEEGNQGSGIKKEKTTGASMRRKSTKKRRKSNGEDMRKRSQEDEAISMFRPFTIDNMDNVSILFADIVGFTRMSSNKTAEQLVGLLNDLFGRFDKLCMLHGCEKISTLGDCYYAVSGCPTARPDHAQCCVELGLAMIRAIAQFDEDRNESVDMRVGVHTGKVLCGIVGTKCYKYDVWSNAVTYANLLESKGQPGRVHVSEETLSFLPTHFYTIEPGQEIKLEAKGNINIRKTRFITGRVGAEPARPLPLRRGGTRYQVADADKKACSLPSMLECAGISEVGGGEARGWRSSRGPAGGGAGSGNSKGSKETPDRMGGSGKWRRSFAPVALELPKLRLPKFTRVSEKVKGKTSSLLKITGKSNAASMEKTINKSCIDRENSFCSLGADEQQQQQQRKQRSLEQIPGAASKLGLQPTNKLQQQTQQRLFNSAQLYTEIDCNSSPSSPPPSQSPPTSSDKFQYQGSYLQPFPPTPTNFLKLPHSPMSLAPPRVSSLSPASPNLSSQSLSADPMASPSADPPSAAVRSVCSSAEMSRTLFLHSSAPPEILPASETSSVQQSASPTFTQIERRFPAHLKNSLKDSDIKNRESNAQASVFEEGGEDVASDDANFRDNGEGPSQVEPSLSGSFNFAFDPSLTRYHQMRKQSDLKLIQCVQQEKETAPENADETEPFSKITLFFTDTEMEQMYREQAHQPRPDEPRTLASTLFNTYFDILVSVLVHFGMAVSLLALYYPTVLWLALLCVGTVWQLGLLSLCQVQVLRRGTREKSGDDREEPNAAATASDEPNADDCEDERMRHKLRRRDSHLNSSIETSTEARDRQKSVGSGKWHKAQSLSWTVFCHLTKWTTWHFCGATLLCLPLASVVANFSCNSMSEEDETLRYFCYLSFIGIIHFCNFAQLNCWMKNLLATIGGVIVIALVATPACLCTFSSDLQSNSFAPASNRVGAITVDGASNLKVLNNSDLVNGDLSSLSDMDDEGFDNMTDTLLSISGFLGVLKITSPLASCHKLTHWFHIEIIVTVVLLLVLVWLLNREFEISYRLSFHGWAQAVRNKVHVQDMKNKAESMLHNIIPKHVANKIKPTNAKYSENHTRVAIMFASIVNFNDFYDEDYCDGKECLRYLNELISDFDDLLKNFENVIKIKTIGSTYMAASGLNPDVRRKNPNEDHHIFELVEFARELQRVIREFNKELFQFAFVLRIGINFGDVTAGVIGTTKLYYDIWGDAVNIASRMDSTGISNRIQVNEECAALLRLRYELEPRGKVFVKGKDHMSVHLLKDPSPT